MRSVASATEELGASIRDISEQAGQANSVVERAAGMREHSVVRCDSRVTCQRQVEPAAKTESADRCHHRFRAVRHRIHRVLAAPRKRKSSATLQRGKLRNFRAGCECALAARNHTARERRVAGQSPHLTLQRVQHAAFEAWVSVVAFQREQQNVFVDL